MSEKIIYDWGQAPPAPPSMKRVTPLGWVIVSVIAGAATSAFFLWILWRPIPGLGTPPGVLSHHVEHWLKLVVRLLLPSWFQAEAAAYATYWGRASSNEHAAILWRGTFALVAAAAPDLSTFVARDAS
jgi:hypothetical protein